LPWDTWRAICIGYAGGSALAKLEVIMPQRNFMNTDIIVEALKSTPPVTVSTVAFLRGWDMDVIIGCLTVVYLGLQIAYLVSKWRKGK